MNTLNNSAELQVFFDRIGALNSDSEPEWGSMNAAQMLAHCAEVQEVLNGKPLKNTPLLLRLVKGMVRKAVVNEKPYEKNAGTHPQYITSRSKRDFETELNRLQESLEEHMRLVDDDKTVSHSLFGEMSPQERAVAGWKHLDHHLRQFGI